MVYDHVRAWLLDFVDRQLATRVLEVAAGSCQYADLFTSDAYTALDVPETWYDAVRQLDVYASADALPFKSRTFDLIFCVAAFDYLPDPVRVLSEVQRCLGEEGTFLIFTYDVVTLEEIHQNASRLPPSRAVASHHVFDEARLRDYAGRESLCVTRLPYTPRPSSWMKLRRLVRPTHFRNFALHRC